jgi:heavy metal efflux system protein
VARPAHQPNRDDARDHGPVLGSRERARVRTLGLFKNVEDIQQTVLTTKSGTPLPIKDIAVVSQGAKVRLGHEGRAIRREDGAIVNNDDL